MSVEQRAALDAINHGLVMWATSDEARVSGYIAPVGVDQRSMTAAIIAGFGSVDESVLIEGVGRNGWRVHPVVPGPGLEAALRSVS